MSESDRTSAQPADEPLNRSPAWPTDEQILTAINDACQDRRLPEGWRGAGMMRRLERLRAEVTAYHAVVRALRPLRLGTPGAPEDGGTEYLYLRSKGRLNEIVDELALELDQATVRYAWTAEVALRALADGKTPARYGGELPDEPQPPVDPLDRSIFMDDPQVPEQFQDRPLLDRALGQLASCEQAADTYERMFGCSESCHEQPDGCSGPHIPEHEIETADKLEAEMGRWHTYLADYGDAIVYTLAVELLPVLAAERGRSARSAEAPR